MATGKDGSTEETQGESTEAPETEANEVAEETPPDEPEAKGEESEGESEEAETDPDAEAKDAGEKDGEQAKPEEKAEEKHRRSGGFQRKIERQERLILSLQEQLAAQQRPGQQQAGTPGKEKTPEEKAAEYLDNFFEERFAAREAKKQQQAAQSEFQRRTSEVRAKHPDFDDVMQSCDAPVSQAVNQLLLTSEVGPVIMYQLAKNPAELARLSALPPLDAAREIGKLEAKVSGPAPQKPKPASRPPAPPTTVNGKSTSTRSLEDLPISEYKRAIRSGRR